MVTLKSNKRIHKQISSLDKFMSIFENIKSNLTNEIEINKEAIEQANHNIMAAEQTIKRVNKIIK